MTSRQFLIALVVGLCSFVAPPAEAQPVPADSLYNLSQTWTRQDNVAVRLDSLSGRVAVVAMGYTTCKQICPAIVADMMWLEKHLPPAATGKVQFAFFSFDALADTPERLGLYAEGHGLDLAHWSLFDADEDTVRELAAALGVGFRPDGAGGFDHTAAISVIAPDGRIIYQQKGTEAHPDELLAKVLQEANRIEVRPGG